jgi:hypothetical protein
MSSPRTCKCIANSTGKRCKNRIREEEKYCRFHKDCDERKSVKKGSVKKGSVKKGSVKKGSVKKGSVKKGSVKKQTSPKSIKKSPLKKQEDLVSSFRELKIESKRSPNKSPRQLEDEYEPGSFRRSPNRKSPNKSPRQLEDEYEPGSVRRSPNKTSPIRPLLPSEKLFSGGFTGIENIIASYSAYYYQMKVTFYRNPTLEFVLAIPGDLLHDFFLRKVTSVYNIEEFIKPIIGIHFPEYTRVILGNNITKVEYVEIDYQDIPNKESIIVLDIYDMVPLFDIVFEPLRYTRRVQPEDKKLLDEAITIVKTRNYDYGRYINILKELNPKLIYKLLPHIPIDDNKLVQPLFDENLSDDIPIIFKYETFEPIRLYSGESLQYFISEPIDMKTENGLRIVESKVYTETYRIKYAVKKFIVEAMIQSIRDNNLALLEIIIDRVNPNNSSNKLLIDYCIEVAKEYNRTNLISILYQKAYNIRILTT